jgi:membrane associated rhomboid family serine protease
MIPLRDLNPTSRPAILTYFLLAANIIIFLLTQQGGIVSESVVQQYAFQPAQIAAGHGYDRLFTAMFLHESLLHVGGNMLFLWIFGNNVEDRLGPLRFAFLYLVSGIVGSLVQVYSDPTSTAYGLGASGAISGVLAAYVLFFPSARVLTLIVPFFVITLRAWLFIGYWIALQVLNIFLSTSATSGVAFFAHVGGFASGFLLALVLQPRRGQRAYYPL